MLHKLQGDEGVGEELRWVEIERQGQDDELAVGAAPGARNPRYQRGVVVRPNSSSAA